MKVKRGRKMGLGTHAGHPTAMANAARMVSPFPYPSALYMGGAKSGKPNPVTDRRKFAAARAVDVLVVTAF